ncbi:bacteriocin immunity protein [Kutzneria sp. CA-103260]|uniref:bacteriocin immunity protein n=1 Tax=Kutzneria sp. CA-103260 TaxID=2802641 RepID=UPI001BAA37AC|nr:bacteriocin immunity protein [Kutzneria sp. CA-103260]QUQ71160.1 Colicin immunity protein / pyocin immunity protein [Kutzneria sp. CA-103260]
MERLTQEEMIALVERVIRHGGDEDQISEWLDQLARGIPNPHIGDLIFWPAKGEEDLTAEQIVDKAMQYRPFAL